MNKEQENIYNCCKYVKEEIEAFKTYYESDFSTIESIIKTHLPKNEKGNELKDIAFSFRKEIDNIIDTHLSKIDEIVEKI